MQVLQCGTAAADEPSEEPETALRTHELSHRDEPGFTLVELLVGMGMMLVIFFAGLGLLEIAQRTEPEIASKNAKVQAAQIGMEAIARDLRQAYAVEMPTPTPTSLTVNTFVQRSTCGGAAGGPARSCRVVYSCSSGTCTRTSSELDGSEPGPAVRIVTDLASNSVFSYTSSTTAPTAVTITLIVEGGSESPEDAITLRDGVVMRNIAGAVGT
ncbi:MAG: type II secretion system GspH family protein [Actinomycetota bacterium]|nr:type II secretion system GspH family protein [Actinomycetota bacterium]